jgi:hypothetical protein
MLITSLAAAMAPLLRTVNPAFGESFAAALLHANQLSASL